MIIHFSGSNLLGCQQSDTVAVVLSDGSLVVISYTKLYLVSTTNQTSILSVLSN